MANLLPHITRELVKVLVSSPTTRNETLSWLVSWFLAHSNQSINWCCSVPSSVIAFVSGPKRRHRKQGGRERRCRIKGNIYVGELAGKLMWLGRTRRHNGEEGQGIPEHRKTQHINK